MSLDRLWAGWRSAYVEAADGSAPMPGGNGCVFCAIFGSGLPDEETHLVHRGRHCAVLLNAYPYTSGHLMVLPLRHVADLEGLEVEEAAELWALAITGVVAVKAAYAPGGVNVGANLGKAAGAGVPGHLHLHVVPRWAGDTNFMTAVAEARVLPEALDTTWQKLTEAWPAG